MLKIGEFSKLSRVSVRMLRHYDQKGLLTPSEIDPMTGYRYYSENHLSQVFRITALKDLGFSLAAIREILTMPGNDVYVVQGEHTYMIPAVKEFLLETDPDRGFVRVKLIEGMQTDAD